MALLLCCWVREIGMQEVLEEVYKMLVSIPRTIKC